MLAMCSKNSASLRMCFETPNDSDSGSTVWLVQQWNPGIRFTLLDKPAVAPTFQNTF